MVKIGHPSMSEAFDPPPLDWEGQLLSKITLDVMEEYFNGDWRTGNEFHKVIITQRLYQTSSNSTQA